VPYLPPLHLTFGESFVELEPPLLQLVGEPPESLIGIRDVPAHDDEGYQSKHTDRETGPDEGADDCLKAGDGRHGDGL
jgi:hypothetical protein